MKRTRVLSVILSAATVAVLIGCSSKESNAPEHTEKSLSEISVTPENEYSDVAQHAEETKDEEQPITPELSEDDILNMPDEDLWNYADLAARGLLLGADTPNPTKSEFRIPYEVGWWAPVSAADADEALKIVTAEWKGGPMLTYKNIELAGENDAFWFFRCDNYYNGLWNKVSTLMVYNIDYYDAKKETVKFELNEDNIRRFFAYRTNDINIWARVCLGEYVIDDGDGFTFRRYYVNVGGGDGGMHDTAILDLEEWHISADGKVEYIGETRLRESEIPFRATASPDIM